MRIYFFCRDHPEAYQDDVVVLTEGLADLGIEFYGNCNYWQRTPGDGDWLVQRGSAVDPADCDAVIVSYIWPRWIDSTFRVHTTDLPEAVISRSRQSAAVFLDLDDGYRTLSFGPEYQCFDLVLRAKYNSRCYHPPNHRPWVLGVSGRVLETLPQEPLPFHARQKAALVNFGASHPYLHGTRELFTQAFCEAVGRHIAIDTTKDDLKLEPADPWDRLMWRQTQKRHCRAYYERLANSQVVAAFCGEMIPPRPYYPKYLAGGRKALLKRKGYEILSHFDSRPPRAIQWDSWRFWEALAAGCLVFNIDLEYYGVKLPVMPLNGVHYVGLRHNRIREGVEEVLRDPARSAKIASAGRTWALEHYSPKPVARRFLEMIRPHLGRTTAAMAASSHTT